MTDNCINSTAFVWGILTEKVQSGSSERFKWTTNHKQRTVNASNGISITLTVSAQNYPCSGKKGGVSHCENGKFICNDGSTSKSKRVCTDESDTKKK